MIAVDCGRVGYEQGLALQRELVARRGAGEVDDVLVVCEHERVYTVGRGAGTGNVRQAGDIRVVRTDRGGDVTYHGPGQVVVYPIIRLTDPRQVRTYVGALERACIAVAADYGLVASTVDGRPGVWVGNDKLVAIGVRVRRGITSHGLAFNVTTDLRDFAGIVPCGIADAGVCSLASLGVSTTMDEVRDRLVADLAATLGRPVQPARLSDLGLPAGAGDPGLDAVDASGLEIGAGA
jgi:lipoyl(octanoyl) transferase